MGKKSRKRRQARQEATSRLSSETQPKTLGQHLQGTLDTLLHPRIPDEPCWKFLPWVLVLAFAARAAVALAGDFVLHPDEVFQYLEPAHRLVFGNGVVHWEFLYGGRSWLIPGLIAAALASFDLLGLGQPHWYIDGVKLLFCAVSLAIPAGMYFFARRHFSEAAARVALVAGAFWYELIGFAHKPMTEFVAVALLCVLLALCVRPLDRTRMVYLTASLAVLVAAIRLQYAPLALLLLGLAFLGTGHRLRLVLAAGAVFLAVGLFDGITWDAGLFHSYLFNIQFNLFLDPLRAGESPPYQFLLWLGLASTGLGALCVLAALFAPRRYGFLLLLIAVTLLTHSLSAHKEYRFIFAVIPLWLLIGSDLAVRIISRLPHPRWPAGALASVFALVSAAGILNALPNQGQVYEGYSNYHGTISFFRERDPRVEAYRYLAQAPGVKGVLHHDRFYHELPGYYYLHRKVPFYDATTTQIIGKATVAALARSASHILTEVPDLEIRGYHIEREFGPVRILRREAEGPEIRKWRHYWPVVAWGSFQLIRKVDPQAAAPPANWNIYYAD